MWKFLLDNNFQPRAIGFYAVLAIFVGLGSYHEEWLAVGIGIFVWVFFQGMLVGDYLTQKKKGILPKEYK